MDKLLQQILDFLKGNKPAISFVAKWRCRIINSVQVAGVWTYQIDENFVPVNELRKLAAPVLSKYGIPGLTESQEQRALHGSTSVNLLQAYNGVNLDLSAFVLSPGSFTYRFFLSNDEIAAGHTETTAVAQGDSLLILVPQT